MGARKDLDQRRLAGAVVADQADDLVALAVEIDALEGMDAAVPFVQGLAANQGVAGGLDEVSGGGRARGGFAHPAHPFMPRARRRSPC